MDLKKSNLTKELNALTDREIITRKRPSLPHSYLDNNNRKELVNALIGQLEAKLYYLKFYGKLESGELTLNLTTFELIFNEISSKLKQDSSFYTHKLNRLFASLDNEQRKGIIMQLLKMLIK